MCKSTLQLEDLSIQEKNMGRKGVSKRKPPQAKARPLAKDNASVGVSSVGRATASQPVKLPDTDKAVIPTIRGSVKHASDSKVNPKKH
jgi:hypothetical protein